MKKNIILIIFTMLLAASCSKNDFGDVPGSPSGETNLDITVKSASGLSGSGEVLDSEVASLEIVVVKGGFYQYKRSAYASEYAKFRSTLKIDDNVDLYFFANCGELLTDDILAEGKTWEEIRSAILITSPYNTVAGKKVLPMWGQAKGVAVTDNVINEISVNLLRAVASANVIFDLDEDRSLDFEPEVAYVYFGADIAYVAPVTNSLVTDNGQVTAVTAPVSPSTMNTNKVYSADAVNGAFVNSLFMLENDAEGGSTANGKNRTRLVIGGYVDGSNELTYFPLDFAHTVSGEVLKVTRNSRYNLRITAVSGEGWTDPDTASGSAKADIDYDVVEWNEHDHDNMGMDGPDYLSVSTKTVTVSRRAGSLGKVKLSGTFGREDISLAFSQNSPNGVGTAVTDGIENDRFRVTINGSGTNFTLTVTALSDYSLTDSSLNNDRFTVAAGRLRFEIDIVQLNDGGWDNGGDNEIDF